MTLSISEKGGRRVLRTKRKFQPFHKGNKDRLDVRNKDKYDSSIRSECSTMICPLLKNCLYL